MNKIKYMSLFSGIGGFELGIGEKGDCIGYSEINKYATEVYEKHFNHRAFGDVEKIDAKELPDFELLVGGFPCQAFSIAGKRRGFEDTRGTLFFEIARIAKEKRPRLLLLENVRGLLSHNKGHTFLTILNTLDEIGYDCQWQVLNLKNFGVPQNRERVFIVGHLRGTRRPEVFPLTENCGADNVISTLTARYYGSQADGSYLHQVSPKGGVLKYVGSIGTPRKGVEAQGHLIQTPHGNNAGGRKDMCPTITGSAFQHNNHVAVPVLTPDRLTKRQNGRRFKEDGDPAFTVTAQGRHGAYDGARVRRLTPTECERLQNFPDGWTEGLSDNQKYKCLGNAVPPVMVKEVINKMLGKQND